MALTRLFVPPRTAKTEIVKCHSLQWRHNDGDGVSNHQPHDCLHRLIRRRSKKTPKLRVTGLSVGEFTSQRWIPAQMASNAENVSISWRHVLPDSSTDAFEGVGWNVFLPIKYKWQLYMIFLLDVTHTIPFTFVPDVQMTRGFQRTALGRRHN